VKRLKRGLWLAALAVWLWLGFGLHRELPRDLGPVVCKLQTESAAMIYGFVGATNRVLVIRRDPNDEWGLLVEGIDAESGDRTPSSASLSRYDHWAAPSLVELRRGLLPTRRTDGTGSLVGYRTLNLATGEWSRIETAEPPNTGNHHVWRVDGLPWRKGDAEDLYLHDGDSAFYVVERWHHWWNGLEPEARFTTMALRSVQSGDLICRTTYDQWIERENTNAAATLGVKSDGTVHSLPHRVNWPLLALCHSILALPIVLLWAVLRWRRKRRLRLASLAP
jgi:hypothetical protein